jgi:hypothetical protein
LKNGRGRSALDEAFAAGHKKIGEILKRSTKSR